MPFFRRENMRLAPTMTIALALLAAGALHAETLDFHTKLEGSKEKIPNNVPATGTAMLELDTATKVVHYTLIYDGLSSPPIKVHLHGPKEEGMKAPAVLDEHSDHPTSPITGTVTLTDRQVEELKAGQLYVNVHSQNYPDGEIRGWLVSGK
jgi:hypothetical protein